MTDINIGAGAAFKPTHRQEQEYAGGGF